MWTKSPTGLMAGPTERKNSLESLVLDSSSHSLDTSKGSYYNNPQYDQVTTDEELKKKYPYDSSAFLTVDL